MAHEEIVSKVAKFVGDQFRAGTPGINHVGAWVVDGVFHITEAKSINGTNEGSQIHKGIGQLLHNRKKALVRGASKLKAHLILEREPSTPMWKEICEEVGLGLTWSERLEKDLPRPPS